MVVSSVCLKSILPAYNGTILRASPLAWRSASVAEKKPRHKAKRTANDAMTANNLLYFIETDIKFLSL